MLKGFVKISIFLCLFFCLTLSQARAEGSCDQISGIWDGTWSFRSFRPNCDADAVIEADRGANNNISLHLSISNMHDADCKPDDDDCNYYSWCRILLKPEDMNVIYHPICKHGHLTFESPHGVGDVGGNVMSFHFNSISQGISIKVTKQ